MVTKVPSNPPKKAMTSSDSTTTAKKNAAAAKDGTKKPARKSRSKTATMGRSGRPASARTAKQPPLFTPRALVSIDDDDELMAHGGGGTGFGRCGGRLLSSKMEQTLCQLLGTAGIVHSHSPRHYEVRFEAGRVAAYAPQIILRGRGREGKSVVIEAFEDPKSPILPKIVAFRAQYGQEFYVIAIGPDEVLDEVPLTSYDESCSTTHVNTLISRLAE